MSKETVKVPDIGGADDVEVIEICIAPGDQVEEGQSLIVLETDKASMEIPSPSAGKVLSIAVTEGANIAEGDVILELETKASADAPAASENEEAAVPVLAQEETSEDTPEATEPEATVAPQATSESSAVEIQEVKVPDIGDISDVEVTEILVQVGDAIEEGDSLLVLESDKASMEIPAPATGVVKQLQLEVGATVNTGDAILVLETAGVSASSAAEVASTTASSVASAPAPIASTISDDSASISPGSSPGKVHTENARKFIPTEPDPKDIRPKEQPKRDVYAGPAVRQLARELGVDLNLVKGSGPKARIQKEDVQNFVRETIKNPGVTAVSSGAGIPAIPAIDFAKFGPVNMEKMSKIEKVTAANMQRSWLNVPHVTQFDDADITELETFRKGLKAEAEQGGVKVTPIAFILKACALALKANPKLNASLHNDGEHIVFKQYVHIGMAVDTPAGLVVPVVRDVDSKSIWEIAAEITDLADKAKNRKLTPDQMRGGCFTVSSLGNMGGTGFTPIVNTPEVAILGVSKLAVKPIWNGSDFAPRKMLPLALSYDHRAVNGADGGRFMAMLTDLLGDIRRMAL